MTKTVSDYVLALRSMASAKAEAKAITTDAKAFYPAACQTALAVIDAIEGVDLLAGSDIVVEGAVGVTAKTAWQAVVADFNPSGVKLGDDEAKALKSLRQQHDNVLIRVRFAIDMARSGYAVEPSTGEAILNAYLNGTANIVTDFKKASTPSKEAKEEAAKAATEAARNEAFMEGANAAFTANIGQTCERVADMLADHYAANADAFDTLAKAIVAARKAAADSVKLAANG